LVGAANKASVVFEEGPDFEVELLVREEEDKLEAIK
jgi:hypothetical protein